MASAVASSGTANTASAYQRSGTPTANARCQSSRTAAGPSTMRVMTTAGSSIPTSVLPRTNTCQYGNCDARRPQHDDGANANAWPTVKSQTK
jgi:hypothetical protein